MKKVVLFAACLICAAVTKAQDGPQNAIKLNPLSLIFSTGNVTYERATGPSSSFQVGVFYTGMKISDLKYSGFGITPEYRFYIAGAKEALNGVYVGPYLRYQSFKIEEKSTADKATFSSFGGGAVIGWQKAWGSGFVLDLFAGPAYNSGKIKVDEGGSEDEFDISGSIDGFGIRTGITLGFSF